MKYKVRTQEGQVLDYQSFGQVEQAWLMGLVEPEDELLEEGKTTWRKAKTFPLLVNARRTGEQAWRGTWFLWVVLGVGGATIALKLLASHDWTQQLIGGLVALGAAMLMLKVTMNAHARRRPH